MLRPGRSPCSVFIQICRLDQMKAHTNRRLHAKARDQLTRDVLSTSSLKVLRAHIFMERPGRPYHLRRYYSSSWSSVQKLLYELFVFSFSGSKREVWENPWAKDWMTTRSRVWWWKMWNFMVWGRLRTEKWRFRSIFVVLTHIMKIRHGSKNLLQRGILYRHEKILPRQGRLQAHTQEHNI